MIKRIDERFLKAELFHLPTTLYIALFGYLENNLEEKMIYHTPILFHKIFKNIIWTGKDDSIYLTFDDGPTKKQRMKF